MITTCAARPAQRKAEQVIHLAVGRIGHRVNRCSTINRSTMPADQSAERVPRICRYLRGRLGARLESCCWRRRSAAWSQVHVIGACAGHSIDAAVIQHDAHIAVSVNGLFDRHQLVFL